MWLISVRPEPSRPEVLYRGVVDNLGDVSDAMNDQ